MKTNAVQQRSHTSVSLHGRRSARSKPDSKRHLRDGDDRGTASAAALRDRAAAPHHCQRQVHISGIEREHIS